MTSLDYVPGEGTIAARVVAYLHSLPVGTEVGTGTIAEALDINLGLIINGTDAAANAGLVSREKFGSRYGWRAGPRKVSQEFIDAHPPKRHVEVRDFVRPATSGALSTAELATVSRAIDGFDEQSAADDRVLAPAEVAAIGLRAAAPKLAPSPSAAPAPEPQPRADRRVPATTAERDLRVGLWSDGSICIERAGRVESYSPTEAAQLMRFFDRFLMRGRDAA